MNISKILFISLFSGTLVLASSSIMAAKKIIWQDGANVFVKYAKQGKANSGGNDHPIKLDANEIRTVLNLIKIQFRN